MTDQKKRGKQPGTFKHDEQLGHNLNIRVSETELQRLDKQAEVLNVSRSDVFRGLLQTLAEETPEIKDGVPITVGKTPMLIPRSEAKKLLRDLTAKLVA